MCRTMEYLIAKPRSRYDIEQVAYNIRKTLKLEKKQPIFSYCGIY